MQSHLFVTPGLGDNSYLLASGDEAVLVDPQRDAWRFLVVAKAQGLTVRYVLETHVHNDYVSGAHEVRAATGAKIVAPARGRYEFSHLPVGEGDELRLGDLRVVALETPGHTPEHVAWLVYGADSQSPAAVFTGGSLMVGSAGRTDLLGPEAAEQLTRAQFHTVRRLASFPDEVRVMPTHGAGSFCAYAPPDVTNTTTIGQERLRNPALAAADEDTFVRAHLSGLPRFPAYFARMGPLNRRGVPALGRLPQPPALSPRHLERRASAWVVDTRSRYDFARAHLPGSLNVELSEAFASYIGWVVPWDTPLVLVLPDDGGDEALAEAATQLLRIGYDRVEGYLQGGVAAWSEAGLPTASYPTVTVDDLCEAYFSGQQPCILDVRQPDEWQAGHIPESRHLFIGDLPGSLGQLPRDQTLWVICASGFRASIAASLITREGMRVSLVASSGVPECLASYFPADSGRPSGSPRR